MLKSIYKTPAGRDAVWKLYDRQLSALSCAWQDLWVETSFGRTHLVETGNLSGRPLLVFHGGNATTAYNLGFCSFLLSEFHVYAVDTIGHPGKSAEVCLPPHGHAYGKWGSEVISALGFSSMACFGGSFGAGVLVKTMCVAPEKVERAALLVPSAIKNAPVINSMEMLLPMLLYWITHDEKWFIRCVLPMAVTRENLTPDILETARCSIDHAKIKTGMPTNERLEDLRRYRNPVYVLAAEQDCLFPGKQVLERAQEAWAQSECGLLRGRGHIHLLSREEKSGIVHYLKGEGTSFPIT